MSLGCHEFQNEVQSFEPQVLTHRNYTAKEPKQRTVCGGYCLGGCILGPPILDLALHSQGGYFLAGYSLGGYSLSPPTLDLALHLFVLEGFSGAPTFCSSRF
mmetsp:Transcript_49198/g.130260  ORF Transcript_49198/g.130260 Transcript_49198/m.130260 type:complete len:102 (+) Transcript_49198:1392-1697(+)